MEAAQRGEQGGLLRGALSERASWAHQGRHVGWNLDNSASLGHWGGEWDWPELKGLDCSGKSLSL